MISAALVMFASIWTLQSQSDPITDERQVTLSMTDGPKVMLFSCKAADGTFAAVLGGFGYIGGSPITRDVTIRIDGGVPVTSRMGVDARHAVTLNAADARSLFAATRNVVVRVDGSRLDPAPTDMVFALQGGARERAQFARQCSDIGVSVR